METIVIVDNYQNNVWFLIGAIAITAVVIVMGSIIHSSRREKQLKDKYKKLEEGMEDDA